MRHLIVTMALALLAGGCIVTDESVVEPETLEQTLASQVVPVVYILGPNLVTSPGWYQYRMWAQGLQSGTSYTYTFYSSDGHFYKQGGAWGPDFTILAPSIYIDENTPDFDLHAYVWSGPGASVPVDVDIAPPAPAPPVLGSLTLDPWRRDTSSDSTRRLPLPPWRYQSQNP